MSNPDVLITFQLLSGNSTPSKTELNRLAATFTRAESTASDVLSFVALDLCGTLKLVAFSDASL
jgi:hypothetical protein